MLTVADTALAGVADMRGALQVFGVILAVAAGLALLVVYPAVILRKYVQIARKMLEDHAPEVENGASEDDQLEGESVSFRAADGHGLEGVILLGRPDRAAQGMVVFAHEFGSDHTSAPRYCRSLLDGGYDVFTFDFRGHGLSAPEEGYRPRQWPSDREQADMIGAILFISSYLEQRGRSRDVALFGISRGAGAAIQAAAELDNVRVIVTDGAFSSDTMLEYLMRRFATIFARIRVVAENHPPAFWRFLRWLLFRECRRKFGCRFPSVRKAVVRLGRRPILLIHGEKDGNIPLEQSQMLYDMAAGPKYLWIVPDARHNKSVLARPEEYARRLRSFLDEHLPPRRQRPAPVRAKASQHAEALPAERVAAPVGGAAPALQTSRRQ